MKKIILTSFFAAMLFLGCHKDEDSPQPISLDDKKEQTSDSLNNDTNGSISESSMDIFLCFGQSNMEGNAEIELVDKSCVPTGARNMVVAKGDAAHYGATRYSWRKAEPPLARFTTGLTPADYFCRTMMQYLPSNQKIGIVMVAIGGASIEAFDKDKCVEYCKNVDADWLKNYLAEYDNNPYQTLVTAAKTAQKAGTIRGILLHQGETNNGDPQWCENVKKIYNDLLSDLELSADKCPLLVGETLRQEEGGVCYLHNSVIAKIHDIIPTAYVISSEGCKGKEDGLHFLASGYRVLGRRYAEQMLKLMNIDIPNSEYKGYYVEGRYLMDKDGNQVNLHGFAQTYSPYFNKNTWNNFDVAGCLSSNKAKIKKIMDAGWCMDFVRLHMDPYWTYSDDKPSGVNESGAHLYFDEAKFRKYLDEVFIPMAEYMQSLGLGVVMRPPGVCPKEIGLNDAYHKYLMNVWSIVCSHNKLRNNPNIMFELANEPVSFKASNGTIASNGGIVDKELSQFFQQIVDMIRDLGCENVLWVPGTSWQQNYKAYETYPIQGKNIGYAVHCYPGWYGSDCYQETGEIAPDMWRGSAGGYEGFKKGWDESIANGVAQTNPIMVTEMDWAAEAHKGRTWGNSITGTAGGKGFGANFKKIMDQTGNVSFLTFVWDYDLAAFDPKHGEDSSDFLYDPESGCLPVFNWFKEYKK